MAAPIDTALRGLKPRDKDCKATDGSGMYVLLSTAGARSFRYDYRANGNRGTLTIGRYEPSEGTRSKEALAAPEYGTVVSLKDARAMATLQAAKLRRV